MDTPDSKRKTPYSETLKAYYLALASQLATDFSMAPALGAAGELHGYCLRFESPRREALFVSGIANQALTYQRAA